MDQDMSCRLLLIVFFAQIARQESTGRSEGPLPLQLHQASGCYGNGDIQRDFINAECQNSERVAMYTIHHASKPRSTTCPTEMLNGTLQECCVPEVGDCSFRLPHNNTREFFTSCTGYRRCQTPVRISRSRLVISSTCNTTQHLDYSNYLIANFYCIAESSLVYIDDTTERTLTSLYLAHKTYPAVTQLTTTQACYISTSCGDVIHIVAIDLHLNCSSWMEVMDDSILTNLSCNANNDYYMKTIYTSSSSAVTIRPMGVGPLRVWLYIHASSSNSSVTVTCGQVDLGYTNDVCFSSSSSSSSSMDISSDVSGDVSRGTYMSTYERLHPSSLEVESGLDTHSPSKRDLEPSFSLTTWSDTAENSFDNNPTREFGGMETDTGLTETDDIHLSTNDRDTLDFGIISSHKPSDDFVQDTMLHPGFHTGVRSSGSKVYEVESESSGHLPIPSTDLYTKTITMTQITTAVTLISSAIDVDESDRPLDYSKFNKTSYFSDSCSDSTCVTEDLTKSVKKTIHVLDTPSVITLSDVSPMLSVHWSESRHGTLPSALPTDVTQSLTTGQLSSTVPAPSGSPGSIIPAILGGAFGSVIGVGIIVLSIIFRRKICNNKVAAENDVEGADDCVQGGSHGQNEVSDSGNLFSGKRFLPNTQIPPLVTQQFQIPGDHAGGGNHLTRLPPLHSAVPSRGLLNTDRLLQPLGHNSERISPASSSKPNSRIGSLPALTTPNSLPDVKSVPRQSDELEIYAGVTLHDSTNVMEKEAEKKRTKKKKRKHNKRRRDETLEDTDISESSPVSHRPSGENFLDHVDSLGQKTLLTKTKRRQKKCNREEETSVPADLVEETEDDRNMEI